MKNYSLVSCTNIFLSDSGLRWVTVADVGKSELPGLEAQESESVVLVKTGPAINVHDTLILLWPNEQEYLPGATTDYQFYRNDAPPWNQTKYFLNFMESTPSILQECATGNFLMPEDDGIQEVIDNLKPVLMRLIFEQNLMLAMQGYRMPAE